MNFQTALLTTLMLLIVFYLGWQHFSSWNHVESIMLSLSCTGCTLQLIGLYLILRDGGGGGGQRQREQKKLHVMQAA